jgi:hypothetical protein
MGAIHTISYPLSVVMGRHDFTIRQPNLSLLLGSGRTRAPGSHAPGLLV